jgi:hypothetical protein
MSEYFKFHNGRTERFFVLWRALREFHHVIRRDPVQHQVLICHDKTGTNNNQQYQRGEEIGCPSAFEKKPGHKPQVIHIKQQAINCKVEINAIGEWPSHIAAGIKKVGRYQNND